jgi:hypothetical protein
MPATTRPKQQVANRARSVLAATKQQHTLLALECPQFTEWRKAMREALRDQVGEHSEHAFAEWDALPADEKLAALLNDHGWGKAAT